MGRARGAGGKVSPSSRDADPMAAPARRSLGLRERELQHQAGGEEIEVSSGSGEGRAGRGSRGDTCAPEQGGEASGWLWENKIKAVPGGGNEEGKGRWPAAVGSGEAAGRQPLCSWPGGWMMSSLGDVTRRAAGEPRDS